MRNAANPFTDPLQVRGALYASADRIAQRTGALLRARVTGRHAGDVIADLAHQAVGTNDVLVADLGCGRGTTTRMLAGRLPAARVVAVDLSAALLAASKRRLADSPQAGTVRADFHRLPFPDASCGLVVAAFCLYHPPSPSSVIYYHPPSPSSVIYDLPPALAGSPAALATALKQRTLDAPVTATSVVTYLVASRPPEAPS